MMQYSQKGLLYKGLKNKKRSENQVLYKLTLIVWCSLLFFNTNGANPFYSASSIHTVQMHKTGWPMTLPVINLRSPETLTLSFDDFDYDSKNYQYTIVHCNMNWEESDIMANEYLNGFSPSALLDYSFSFNTTREYIHYRLKFPNEDMQVKISGNFLIKVFDLDDVENPVVVYPFYVTEGEVSIEPRIRYSINSNVRESMQEVNFSVFHSSLNIVNPSDEVKVVVMQNYRWDNLIDHLKPTFVRNQEFSYEYNKESLFDGGNEYRWLDIRSTRFAPEHVQAINFYDPYFHFTLFPGRSVARKPYFFRNDFNGKYYIEVREDRDPEIEADYVYVHFSIPQELPFLDGEIYVTGGLNNGQFNQDNKMMYNVHTQSYELTMLLKQGFYNYQYCFLRSGSAKADVSKFEGNFSQTENDYQIFVYYRGVADYYDRLVGVELTNSLKYSVSGSYK